MLHVNGQLQLENNLVLNENTPAITIPNGDLRIFTGGAEKMRIDSAGVLTSKSHIVTGIDNTAFEVKTNHSGNPSAMRIAGTGSINGIGGSFQSFYVLNVMQDSGSLKSIYAAGDVKTDGQLIANKLVSTNGILELDDDGSHNGIINLPLLLGPKSSLPSCK